MAIYRSELNIPEGITTYRVQFGQLGKTDTPLGRGITEKVEAMIPSLQPRLETGGITSIDTSTFTVAHGQGWENVVKALAGFEAGDYQGRKPVVQVADF